VLTRASRRVVGMAADPVRDYAFDEQAVTMRPPRDQKPQRFTK